MGQAGQDDNPRSLPAHRRQRALAVGDGRLRPCLSLSLSHCHTVTCTQAAHADACMLIE